MEDLVTRMVITLSKPGWAYPEVVRLVFEPAVAREVFEEWRQTWVGMPAAGMVELFGVQGEVLFGECARLGLAMRQVVAWAYDPQPSPFETGAWRFPVRRAVPEWVRVDVAPLFLARVIIDLSRY